MTAYPTEALKRKWQRTDAKIVEVLVSWRRLTMAMENADINLDSFPDTKEPYRQFLDAITQLEHLRHENPRKGQCPPVTMTLTASPCSGHTCALWPCEAVDMSHPRKETP